MQQGVVEPGTLWSCGGCGYQLVVNFRHQSRGVLGSDDPPPPFVETEYTSSTLLTPLCWADITSNNQEWHRMYTHLVQQKLFTNILSLLYSSICGCSFSVYGRGPKFFIRAIYLPLTWIRLWTSPMHCCWLWLSSFLKMAIHMNNRQDQKSVCYITRQPWSS